MCFPGALPLSRAACVLPRFASLRCRLNEPRFVTLPAMLKAKKAPIERITPGALGVDVGTPLSRLLRCAAQCLWQCLWRALRRRCRLKIGRHAAVASLPVAIHYD